MADEIIHGAADVRRIFALHGGGAFAQQGDSRQRGHGRGIAIVIGRPMTQAQLMHGQPLQPAVDDSIHVGVFYARRRDNRPYSGREHHNPEKQ